MNAICRIGAVLSIVAAASSRSASVVVAAPQSSAPASPAVRCTSLLSIAEVQRVTGLTDVKIVLETSTRPEQYSCGYSAAGLSAFNLQLRTGENGRRTANALSASASSLKLEAVAGLGVRASWASSQATLYVDTGRNFLAVAWSRPEQPPAMRKWLEALARVVVPRI